MTFWTAPTTREYSKIEEWTTGDFFYEPVSREGYRTTLSKSLKLAKFRFGPIFSQRYRAIMHADHLILADKFLLFRSDIQAKFYE